ncbi:flagellar hook protein [Sulfitobacter sp. S0837]|uniref:flagellin n=1 Tax=Sulfitobacter maritimus TaxID=2741719 RepID=UPI001582C1AF|nr:flagellin [Sulfitobacter maritimus]NUH66764.1 flagellar hook protein [Sulfitobacter maritimus]
MSSTSIGDLAQSFMLRNRNTALKQEMTRLTTELSTGQVADTRAVLGGNYSYLTEIERKLETLTGYDVATTEANHMAGAMQSALERIESLGTDLSLSLIAAGTSAVGTSKSVVAADARNAMAALVGTMNSNIAGRSMFSGTATDRAPLPDDTALLDALKTAITSAGATSPTDIMAAATNWFNDPAGFAATAYQGSDNALAPMTLSETESVRLDIRATDPDLKTMLRLSAVAALAEDPALALTEPEQTELFEMTGQQMLAGRDGITSLRAKVGFAEARIEQVSSRNAAEKTSLDYAKANLLASDPYDAATKLEEVQFQLQSLYSVTVRMSQLSLVNFL